MMNNETFAGFGEAYTNAHAESGTKPEAIIPGAYVGKILSAHLEQTSKGKKYIRVYFDIAEGDFEGYYDALYKYASQYDKPEEGKKAKWGGVFDIWWPNPADGEDRFNSSMFRLKAAVACINNSNPTKPPINPAVGFGTADFIGKYIGLAMGSVEWEFAGRSGWKAKCRYFCNADDVREGKAKTPAPKPLNKGVPPVQPVQPSNVLAEYNDILSDGSLPF